MKRLWCSALPPPAVPRPHSHPPAPCPASKQQREPKANSPVRPAARSDTGDQDGQDACTAQPPSRRHLTSLVVGWPTPPGRLSLFDLCKELGVFVETSQATAFPQSSEEGKDSWGKQQVDKQMFLEKLSNKMSTESSEKLPRIPGDMEVTQVPRATACRERPAKAPGLHFWLSQGSSSSQGRPRWTCEAWSDTGGQPRHAHRERLKEDRETLVPGTKARTPCVTIS